ncbi:MAG TPA: sigma-54 dependent transcriptional regulator [bacterium]|nr:sigma-54 dependent transcriptional regulator [bacterium]HPN35024.1 sigma-54 dependent transcriptional regulator [bacterium]
MKANILVVEDNEDLCQTIAEVMKKEGHSVRTAYSGEEALNHLEKGLTDLVLLDIKLPRISGLEVLAKIREQASDLLVIMITALTDARPAVEALKSGAYDYLLKPFELDELKLVVAKALETHRLKLEVARLKEQQRKRFPDSGLYGDSPAIQEVQNLIKIIAETPRTSVLIEGESGTGKELVANAIHASSSRADKTIIKINCSAIPENLLESELFGHEKGAFTDAKTTKRGLFELAHGGTLFLDEIASMKMSLQPKLLRVLETSSFRRIGGTTDITVDVRIIAATNQNLEACVREGLFREDLLYRLKVMVIRVPALREHTEDILPIAKMFIEQNNREFNKSIRGISLEASDLMLRYSWPGNVRELKNVLERAVILCKKDEITAELLHLEPIDQSSAAAAASPAAEPAKAPQPVRWDDASVTLSEVEKQHILQVLEKNNHNKSKTAKVLGISRSTLREKLKEYGIG